MDNTERLENRADYIANNISLWELSTVASIAKKLGNIGKLTDEEIKQFDVEKEAEKEWKRAVSAFSGIVVLNIKSLKRIYTDEMNDWHEANKPLYDYRGVRFVDVNDNPDFQAIINSFSKENAKNITQTSALYVIDKNDNVIRLKDMIYKAFSEAVEVVSTGKGDFYSVMRDTVQKLGGSGVRVDYGGGVTRRLDTVTRQNMLWGVKQAHKEYNDLVGQQLNTDGIEIDYHANARPSHRFMQGKQYAKGEAKTVNGVYYPSAEKSGVYERLYDDYNCYHYETDIILGVSEPRYTEEELKRFIEKDQRLYKIGDIEKDGYGWGQSMRHLETEIRRAKDEINALEAFGNSEAEIKLLKERIKAYKTKYTEISQITGIAEQPQKMSVTK